tara:strand:- start:736 stop:930 length:195 start_codon:yes stop_codon:yes gene_type:complete
MRDLTRQDLHRLLLDLASLAQELEAKAKPGPFGALDRARAEGVRLAMARIGEDLGPLPEGVQGA